MGNADQFVDRGRTPARVFWSLIAGFVGWGADLGISYTVEQHTCSTGHHYLLHVITIVTLIIALSGLAAGISGFRRLPGDSTDHGGNPHDRAHFQSLMGIVFSASMAIVIIANAVPRFILHPCD